MTGGEALPWAAPLADAAEPALLGAIERVTAEALEGWLRDPARPLWPVIFRVSLGEADLGRHIANLPGTPGRLRFRVPLPAGVAPDEARQALILTLDGRRGLTPEGWQERAPEGWQERSPEGWQERSPEGWQERTPEGWQERAPEGRQGSTPEGRLELPTEEPQALAPEARVERPAETAPAPERKPETPPDPLPEPKVAAPPAEEAAAPPSPPADATPQDLAHLLDQLEPAQRLVLVEKAFQAKEWPVVLALTENLPGTARDPRLVTFRGRAFFYQGRHAEAVETLRFIQARHPQRHTAMLFLGRALAQLGQLPEARQVMAHCRAGNPAEPRYVFEAGRIAARLVQGDDGQAEPRPELMGEATELLRQAMAMRPEDHRPPRLLAQLALLEGRLGEAITLLETAVARAPQQAELRMEQARLLTRLNRLEEALEAAEAAARLDPLRDGAGFAVRILQRWLEARRTGPLTMGPLTLGSLTISEVAPA